jgi:hypothetical protein
LRFRTWIMQNDFFGEQEFPTHNGGVWRVRTIALRYVRTHVRMYVIWVIVRSYVHSCVRQMLRIVLAIEIMMSPAVLWSVAMWWMCGVLFYWRFRIILRIPSSPAPSPLPSSTGGCYSSTLETQNFSVSGFLSSLEECVDVCMIQVISLPLLFQCWIDCG